MRLSFLFCLLTAFSAGTLLADLPPGQGHDETLKVCGKCHSPEQAASMRQSRAGWEETIGKMIGLGAEGTDDEYNAVLEYLAKNFGTQMPKRLNLNTATATELEATLGVSHAESAAIVDFRTAKGNFKDFDDLKNVPGLDFDKIAAKKAAVTF